jgi:hypothetical protein
LTTISRAAEQSWRNYHHTHERSDVDVWSFGSTGAVPGPIAALQHSAALIGHMLGTVEAERTTLQTLGSAWSFSEIVAGSGALVQSALENHIFALPPDLVGPAALHPDRMILASAGTTVARLNRFLGTKLSLRTSGAHDGQMLGGLLGTGTHGSVIGYGAFQNQVRGVHMVTDDGESWWIERGPEPWLAAHAAADLATHVVLEEALFEATLVHLGGLGVVNAVLLEVDAGYLLDIVKVKRALSTVEIAQLAAGEFEAFAKACWPQTRETPYYVEVILDPFAPFAPYLGTPNPALITMFFKREAAMIASPGAAQAMATGPTLSAPHEALNLLAGALDKQPEHNLMFPLPQVIAWLVAKEYRPEPAPGEAPRQSTWGAANGPHKKQSILGFEFELFNAAFAIRREHLLGTLRTMLDAFHMNGGGHQVFTLRFVSHAAGLLAFTRFPETVVVNMDGARTSNSAVAAQNVALALERAGIDFSQHWGKQGVITPNRFKREYGHPEDAATPAGRWRGARARLLARPAMRDVIVNDALLGWNLA